MSEYNYTPEPWSVDDVSAHINEVKSGLPLAALQWPSDDRSEDETRANAHLIAAAPDMFGVCESLMSAIDGHAEWSPDPVVDHDYWNEDAHIEVTLTVRECRALKSALSKAKGGSDE